MQTITLTDSIIMAFSGLGIFLFGIYYMEYALKEFAGFRLKRLLKKSTDTIPKSIFTGALATTLLQSSSVVTLLTLSFVSVSLISLKSAIGVIFGSNIGTTVTAWFVALLGFKLQIESFALPIAGLGGLGLMFLPRNSKYFFFAKFLIGFGFLFLGLDYMKTSIEALSTSFDLQEYSAYSLYYFVLIGAVITAIIQSSSATTALVLSALSVSMLTFEGAAAMLIGANIGTTITALLGAIGGTVDKKRAAVAHFIFNIFTAVIVFFLLPYLSYFILNTLHMKNDAVIALAIFHTLFNVLGVLLLAPFIPLLAIFLNNVITFKKLVVTHYIHLVDANVPESACIAVRDEIESLFLKTLKFTLLLANVKSNDLLLNQKVTDEILETNTDTIDFDSTISYKNIKTIESAIFEFISKINRQGLDDTQSQNIDKLYTSARESAYAAKIIKDTKNNLNEFSQSEDMSVQKAYNRMRKHLINAIRALHLYMNHKIDRKEFEKKYKESLHENEQLLKQITFAYKTFGLDVTVVTSLLNTNQSLFLALNSLYQASEVFEMQANLLNGS
ncbi:Na/Pi symporter [Sulfurovum sp.]|uniref:Na/Pi cotransporter family protein n=1 Tax=Sulfurovum sp. TaxID=1969726 RepID=UPI002867F3D3|nr:Na/Pi symporter [Sulfurovum sp.]